MTKPQLKGNTLCLKCHNGSYTKAPVIDAAGHGHHKLTDKGGECVGCHMPVTVYMQRHSRHDHGFTIPDPLLTKELNIPNACNRCHTDQSADWAVKYTDQWYGTNMDRFTRDRARWIAAAENGQPEAKDKLIGLLAATNQSPYWQAVAAAFLDQWAEEPATKAALLAALQNDHPLVREHAVRSLEPAMADTNVLAALNAMESDSSRNVRVAAAWVLRASVDLQSRAGRICSACSTWRQTSRPASLRRRYSAWPGRSQRTLWRTSRKQPPGTPSHRRFYVLRRKCKTGRGSLRKR